MGAGSNSLSGLSVIHFPDQSDDLNLAVSKVAVSEVSQMSPS